MMIEDGAAASLEESMWADADSNERGMEKGNEVTTKLMMPEFLLFVNEVRSNVSTSDDGTVVGTDCVDAAVGDGARVRRSTAHCRWTLWSFALGDGTPSKLVAALQGTTLSFKDAVGTDIRATVAWAEKDKLIEDDAGEGKLHPGGPTCFVNFFA